MCPFQISYFHLVISIQVSFLCFHGLTVAFCFSIDNILLYSLSQFIYSDIYLSMDEHLACLHFLITFLCKFSCMHKFLTLLVNTKEHKLYIVWYKCVLFCKKLQNCIRKRLSHFSFLLTVRKNSSCFTSLSSVDFHIT
jgi:hypothetical protein